MAGSSGLGVKSRRKHIEFSPPLFVHAPLSLPSLEKHLYRDTIHAVYGFGGRPSFNPGLLPSCLLGLPSLFEVYSPHK